MNKVERHPRRRLAFMAGERRCWQRSKHFYRACHASRQVGRSRECNERCTLERDVRRERMRLECGKSSGAYMTNPLSKKLVTILFKAAKRCSACSHQSSLYATARTTFRTLSQNTPVYIDARFVLPPIFFNPCAATYRVERYSAVRNYGYSKHADFVGARPACEPTKIARRACSYRSVSSHVARVKRRLPV